MSAALDIAWRPTATSGRTDAWATIGNRAAVVSIRVASDPFWPPWSPPCVPVRRKPLRVGKALRSDEKRHGLTTILDGQAPTPVCERCFTLESLLHVLVIDGQADVRGMNLKGRRLQAAHFYRENSWSGQAWYSHSYEKPTGRSTRRSYIGRHNRAALGKASPES